MREMERRLGLGPGGGSVHFTEDDEVRVEGNGCGGRVRDVGLLTHKYFPNCLQV